MRTRAEERVAELGELWGDLKGWSLSGSLATFLTLDNFLYFPRNIDIATNCKPDVLDEMVRRALVQRLLAPTRRTRSRKINIRGGPIREEVFVPMTADIIEKNRRENRNFMFRRCDIDGNIIPQTSMAHCIRIYNHIKKENGSLLSLEDGRIVNSAFLSPFTDSRRIVYKNGDKKVSAVDLRYIAQIQRDMVEGRNTPLYERWRKRNTKNHVEMLKEIQRFFERNPIY